MIKSVDDLTVFTLDGKHAIIELGSTKRVKGEWLVSGSVVLPLLRPNKATNRPEPGPRLSFPFEDARNEAEAIRQAADQMRKMAETLRDLADKFLREDHPSTSHPGEPSGLPTP